MRFFRRPERYFNFPIGYLQCGKIKERYFISADNLIEVSKVWQRGEKGYSEASKSTLKLSQRGKEKQNNVLSNYRKHEHKHKI